MGKIGRNDTCPCGSGKKYKRCCLAAAAPGGYTGDEREAALLKVERFVEEECGAADDEASEAFYGAWGDRLDELDAETVELSEAVFDMWFFTQCELEDSRRVIDHFLDDPPLLSPGERRYLEMLRETTLQLYEVEDLRPGVSVTLREVGSRRTITVHEKTASRTLERHTLLAARVIGLGASGQPEMERGVFIVPDLVRTSVLSQLETHRDDMALFLHDAWMTCLLDPPLPRMKTTDGEDLLLTRSRFEAADPEALAAALDRAPEVEREQADGRTVWIWSGPNREGKPIMLGRMALAGTTLDLECQSAPRAERGRALLEALAGAGLRHVATSHESPEAILREAHRKRRAGGDRTTEPQGESFPREVQEALHAEHAGRYYREWLDIPVPALRDHTPRAAAQDPALRPALADLIHGLERHYEADLKRGAPAYDPSWMWAALGLVERETPREPPPLAHERLAEKVPGIAELCGRVAAVVRSKPGFDDASTIAGDDDLASNVDVQRFRRTSALEVPWLRQLVNFELHRRKTFWVDEALAYMLAQTDVDVPGSQLRVPFPAFAVVFSDRHVLSLAERFLSASPDHPQAGYLLKALTVYIEEELSASGRILRVAAAPDPLGADPPHPVFFRLPLDEAAPITRLLDELAPTVVTVPPSPDPPLRALLHVTLNAILYAASAGVEAEVRYRPGHTKDSPARAFHSEQVFFLPGTIDISHLRGLQELSRVPSGRHLMHRFMVRGHWRRPAESWKEQRPRWIAPYWKGPDLAAVIEKTYRLKP